MASKFRILLVDEGSAGHSAQSMALAESIRSTNRSVTVSKRVVGKHFSGIQRGVIRAIMGRNGKRVPQFLERSIEAANGSKLANLQGPPDLIISSGGKSVFLGRVLANRFDVPYIFVGERKPYPATWFHTVFTPSAQECAANDCRIELIPTGVTPEKARQGATDYNVPSGSLWAMIVGGNSKSHRFQENDWKTLAQEMNELAARWSIRWLLTTSRRTGTEAEQVLKNYLDPDSVADAVWWSESPRKLMLAFLGSSEQVFVTQDSVTMVTEAISSGRPVSVISPPQVTFPRKSFMKPYLESLEANGMIQRQKIGRLGAIKHEINPGFVPDPTAQMLAILKQRLPEVFHNLGIDQNSFA